MGTLNDYRLADWFYTDNELQQMDAELLEDTPQSFNSVPIKEMVVMFTITSKNGNTGKMMIVKTTDVVNYMKALNRVWEPTGLVFSICKVGKLDYGAEVLANAIDIVLTPYKYSTKFSEYPGSHRIYRYEHWMPNLIIV